MKLSLMLGYSGARVTLPMELVHACEAAGFDSVWTAEAWGSDAVTPAAWILAQTTKIKVGTGIMQVPARTPACAAMTGMTLDHLSGGRFLMGFGPSGPQVVEGWHGNAYGKPLTRLKEYISIVRKILAREEPLTHEGEHYQIPYNGPGATGLGKPLKSIIHGDPTMKIFTGATSPAGLKAAGEVADGVFPIWVNPNKVNLVTPPIEEGFAAAEGEKSWADFELAPFVRVAMDDDLDRARMTVKHQLALYIGGMGARDKNFYNDYTKRMGYEEAATHIQDAFLSGDKQTAAEAVPDDLVDECSLVGPADRIRERLADWKAAGERGDVDTMVVSGVDIAAAEVIANELL